MHRCRSPWLQGKYVLTRLRLLKWIGASACLFLGVISVTSALWCIGIQSGAWVTTIQNGQITAWRARGRNWEQPPIYIIPMERSWQEGSEAWTSYWAWPKWDIDGYNIRVVVPLWVLWILLGVPTAFLWCAGRRRACPGRCRCGYDLFGNTSGRCPECGEGLE